MNLPYLYRLAIVLILALAVRKLFAADMNEYKLVYNAPTGQSVHCSVQSFNYAKAIAVGADCCYAGLKDLSIEDLIDTCANPDRITISSDRK